jgi:ESCRT-I complex subunit TSG101
MPSSGGGHESIVASYLSRAGYRNSDRCKPDILGALHHYPGLKPKIDKFSFNDGRTRDLLCLFGTIPVPYRGSMYNIPVALWILDTHPIHAPLCFVQPTAEMQIRVSSHVDGNGKIYLPYLHEWDGNNSDILGLIQMCIITFGEMPPVFARPAGQPQPAPVRILMVRLFERLEL